ncbi:MAG: aspartate aminotransferase family protein [Desulfovibrio sp.]|nr:aspartate aminotransferase family protein [Desulfovibrio sp.]
MSEAFEKIRDEEKRLLCRSYSRYPLAIVRGEGSRLWDIDGREYIDLLAGIAVVGLGHCNPELRAALDAQAGKLWHVSNLFYQPEQLELAEILLSTTHHDKAFFCNSGAEANEACIKLARRYMRKVKKRDAYEIITLKDAFHGRTLGTLAATGRESLADGFAPLPEGFAQVPPNDPAALEAKISPVTAAVMLECVQGESGVVPLPPEYLREVEAICRKRDILLICDEVQCGLCRTGRFWAFQHAGIKPDAISAAKSLANGLPMGAMLATEEMAKGFEPGSHATTFGGGALVSAVARKTIEIMSRDDMAAEAADKGAELKEELLKLQCEFPEKIKEVRGLGLMLGVEFRESARPVWEKLLEAGFICGLSHEKVLRLLPPLTIARDDLRKFAIALQEIAGA